MSTAPQTPQSLPPLKHLLVTGGAGFIGSNFVHYMINKYPELRVTVLDKLTYAGNLNNLKAFQNNSRFKFIKADLTNKEELNSVLNPLDINLIAHFAAESHVDRSILGPEQFIQTNIIGTFNLLEWMRQNKWPEKIATHRFLHVSTDEVYGSLGDTGYFTETTPYQPNSPYSASKASSDLLVRSYVHTYQMPAVTSNCSNNYGPYHFPEKLIPLMILNCLNQKPLPVYGAGKNVRDWLYVEDHCSALDLILIKGRIGETYNVGGHNERQNIQIVQTICQLMDQKLDRPVGTHAQLIQYVKDRPGHDLRYAIDPSKLVNELGWKPQTNFESGIQKTIDWYLENRDWWQQILSGEYQKYYQQQYESR